MEAAQPLGKKSQNRFLRLQFELASGRVLAGIRSPGRIARTVPASSRRCTSVWIRRSRVCGRPCASRICEQDKARLRGPNGVTCFAEVSQFKGFGLIARKASQESSVLRKPIGRCKVRPFRPKIILDPRIVLPNRLSHAIAGCWMFRFIEYSNRRFLVLLENMFTISQSHCRR